MINLSKRLKCLAQYVPQGSVAADIGTDHGYLPVYLVLQDICPKVIAVDINRGPLEAARSNVQQRGVQDKIDLRLGNGLQVLEPGEADVIVIAGMGGGTIRDIVAASPQVAAQVSRLILQPMADERDLREYLLQHGWRLKDEEMLVEDDRLYPVLVAERGQEDVGDPILLEVGPRLVEKKHPLLKRYIHKLEEKYQRVLDGLQKSSRPTAQTKAVFIEKKIEQLRELVGKLES
ncbi:tRNA (adenine(22)-N(1))-methyltransferase [Desulfotomaculum sp. 1211_IL3151]|uniref:tRNA (adenine(22)-N(1))-methyltransferase n=1 Tax=Desulfotomaculum sp. 1211_IL3151 TaxID=3084055 RepID=UPI002FDABB09